MSASVSIVPRLPIERAPAPDPHLTALLSRFEGTTRQRVETMIVRALKLGDERTEVLAEHEIAQARFDRAAANSPSRFSDQCTPQRRKVLDDLEDDCERLENRLYRIDGQFVGVQR